MKSQNILYLVLTAFLLMVCSLFLANNAIAQDEDAKQSKIHIKIITEKDGKVVKIDTTFDGADFDNEAFKKELKEKYGIEVEDLGAMEGVQVKVDSGKAEAVGVGSEKGTQKVIVIKEVEKTSGKDMEVIWKEEVEAPDSATGATKLYFISEDGEKYTIKETEKGGEKVIWVTADDEYKVIKSEGGEKVIWVTDEGEEKVIETEDGEKVLIIKMDGDKCGKDKKSKEETIKVIVITDDEDEDTPKPNKK